MWYFGLVSIRFSIYQQRLQRSGIFNRTLTTNFFLLFSVKLVSANFWKLFSLLPQPTPVSYLNPTNSLILEAQAVSLLHPHCFCLGTTASLWSANALRLATGTNSSRFIRKVVGSNPGAGKGYFLAKSKLQSTCRIIFLWKLYYRVRARKWDTIINFFHPFLNSFPTKFNFDLDFEQLTRCCDRIQIIC